MANDLDFVLVLSFNWNIRRLHNLFLYLGHVSFIAYSNYTKQKQIKNCTKLFILSVQSIGYI